MYTVHHQIKALLLATVLAYSSHAAVSITPAPLTGMPLPAPSTSGAYLNQPSEPVQLVFASGSSRILDFLWVDCFGLKIKLCPTSLEDWKIQTWKKTFNSKGVCFILKETFCYPTIHCQQEGTGGQVFYPFRVFWMPLRKNMEKQKEKTPPMSFKPKRSTYDRTMQLLTQGNTLEIQH